MWTSGFHCVFVSRIGFVTYTEDKEFGFSARRLHNCPVPKLLSITIETLFGTSEVLGYFKVCVFSFEWVARGGDKIKEEQGGMQ